jgi:hypothetical protein
MQQTLLPNLLFDAAHQANTYNLNYYLIDHFIFFIHHPFHFNFNRLIGYVLLFKLQIVEFHQFYILYFIYTQDIILILLYME